MFELIILAAVLAADLISKYLVDLYLSPVGTSVPLIPNVFHLTYARNTGAAWGLMQGRRTFFIVVTTLVCICVLIFLIKNRKKLHWVVRVALALVLAGAIGNLIDRVVFSYVRDMFDFCLIQFPVFNVADSALTIGAALVILNVLFMKEHSLLELDQDGSGSKKKGEPVKDVSQGASDAENASENSKCADAPLDESDHA